MGTHDIAIKILQKEYENRVARHGDLSEDSWKAGEDEIVAFQLEMGKLEAEMDCIYFSMKCLYQNNK